VINTLNRIITFLSSVPMKTTSKQTSDPVNWGPLVLHIRRLRQWYGDSGISQKELANVSGIPTRAIAKYESCRDLPRILSYILRISLALKVPVEWLIDPRVVNQIRTSVERRRATYEPHISMTSKVPDNLPIPKRRFRST